MELKLPHDCLAVFTDDTGHEALVPGQPVYGLGGCAVLAQHLDAAVKSPWREVRRQVTGSPDTPLHASDFGRSATKDQILAVAEFFRQERFARLGAIVSTETSFPDELGPLPTIAMVLNRRIADIARWTRFRSISVIFESSERADPLMDKAFQNISFEEDGRRLPVDCYFIAKAGARAGSRGRGFHHACDRPAGTAQSDEAWLVCAGFRGGLSRRRSEARELYGDIVRRAEHTGGRKGISHESVRSVHCREPVYHRHWMSACCV